MSKMKKNLMIEIIVLTLFISVGFSYAFFVGFVRGNDDSQSTVITTGDMRIEYNDGSSVSLENAIPGSSVVKTFSVTNIGNTASNYDIYFSEVLNAFMDKTDLEYSLESEDSHVSNLNIQVPDRVSKIASNVYILPNETHRYSLTLRFLNKDENQDDNKGAVFSAKISINDYSSIELGSLSSDIFEQLKYVELNEEYNKMLSNNLISNELLPKYDYVQPWILNDYNYQDLLVYVDKLKRAGYEGIILNYSMEYEVKNNNINTISTWYESSYFENGDGKSYNHEVIDNLIEILSLKNMNIYIGLPNTNDWFDNSFSNTSWVNKVNSFNSNVLEELYNKYSSYSNFVGWYYPFELYSNDQNYYDIWSSMINNTITKINQLDSSKKLMISYFVSGKYNVDFNNVKNDFKSFISNTNFRSNDIVNMQDCLATSYHRVDYVNSVISAIKEAIDESNKGVKFWLNVENYKNATSDFSAADLKRYILQLKISSAYVDELSSFSYSHYYLSNSKDKEYRNHYTDVTGNRLTMLSSPAGGSVYEDEDGREVVVPAGFNVDLNNNKVSNGLIIKDSFGNEYVWIPVDGGVKSDCYTYKDNEYKAVYYTRYLSNGISCGDVSIDTLPSGISSDLTQINKYHGFYIGRYESSYDYNLNNPRVMIKPGTNANETFAYQYADSSYYTGFMWNNVTYENAKSIAENMSSIYDYNENVKTGLLNGRQFDTIMRWIHSNDSTYSMIYDSRNWGNYNDSNSNAINGNYEVGVLKPSGSNENWKFLNIYDLAGNLGEWTSDKSSNKPVIRGGSYNFSGQYGLSNAMSTDSFQYPNIGFRVVLYIK